MSKKKFCLSLHYNRSNSLLYVNDIKIYQVNAKDLELKPYPLCLGNISKYFAVDNMRKTGLNSYMIFLFFFYSIDVGDIVNIHMYLMKKDIVKQCLNNIYETSFYCVQKTPLTVQNIYL